MTIWEQLYNAIQEKDCETAKKLFNSLTLEDKESPYFLKYAQLLAKFCPQKDKKNQIFLKLNLIKCPSCWAFLTFSPYNQYQFEKLKSGADSVVFVCNYCGNKIAYSKKPFKTIFTDYSVGKEVKIGLNKYTLAWAVRYEGNYLEWNEKWKLKYIEWLAYDKNWEIYYISESRAILNGENYDELEVSRKVDFPFVIKKILTDKIDTSDWTKSVEEYDEVKVVSVLWDVNKQYKIWEKVKLWNFSKYALEEETNGEYVERNLYENVFLNDYYNPLSNVFWKDYPNLLSWDRDLGWDVTSYISLIFLSLVLLLSFNLKCIFLWLPITLFSFFLVTDKKFSIKNILVTLALSLVFSVIICLLIVSLWGSSSSWGWSYSSSSSYWWSSSYGGGK